jgi:hypothetical protein
VNNVAAAGAGAIAGPNGAPLDFANLIARLGGLGLGAAGDDIEDGDQDEQAEEEGEELWEDEAGFEDLVPDLVPGGEEEEQDELVVQNLVEDYANYQYDSEEGADL